MPDDGAASPAISLSNVDFPQPDGPSRLTNSPGKIVRSMPASAAVPVVKVFDTPDSRSSGRRGAPAIAALIGVGSGTALMGIAAVILPLNAIAPRSFASCPD